MISQFNLFKFFPVHSSKQDCTQSVGLTRSSDSGKSKPARIDFLDGWRGLAIGFVLIDHFLPAEGIALGRMGVDVFFVLSGALMANILFVRNVPIKVFYKRRISRILPVFLLYVSLVYCASLLLSLTGEHENYLVTVLFLRSYFPVIPDLWNTGLPIGHIWSLNVEEHCYVFLSLLTLIGVFRGREYIPLLLIGLGSILLHIVYTKLPSIATENYHLRTEILASHLLISAGYFLVKEKFSRMVPAWLPLVTFGLALLCYREQAPWFASWLFTPFLLAFTVNHLDLLPSLFRSVLKLKPLCWLGMWSFSIYLWQQPFYFYCVKNEEMFYLAGPVMLLLSLIVGVVSFYFFENPVRKYLNDNW